MSYNGNLIIVNKYLPNATWHRYRLCQINHQLINYAYKGRLLSRIMLNQSDKQIQFSIECLFISGFIGTIPCIWPMNSDRWLSLLSKHPHLSVNFASFYAMGETMIAWALMKIWRLWNQWLTFRKRHFKLHFPDKIVCAQMPLKIMLYTPRWEGPRFFSFWSLFGCQKSVQMMMTILIKFKSSTQQGVNWLI